MNAALHRYFEDLYTQSPDPYGTHDRWYEQRKRDLVLASLPRARFAHCYEPGCGAGALTLRLAERCDAVLAADFCDQALQSARSRTQALPQVRLARHQLPQDWPVHERFDLIVLSELSYFLPLSAIEQVARDCMASLAPDGVVLACDWLPAFAERACPTEAAHAALSATGLHPLLTHAEADFRLQVWARDARSVAQREGIR
jgi:SAM-dependent methyltransferase